MSRTTILSVHPDKEPESIVEYRNGWGSAPIIWDALVKKYCPPESFWWDSTKKLWPKHKDKNIPVLDRILLVMTFDRVVLAKANFKRAAADIRQWLKENPVDPERVNHWPALADLLDADATSDYIGIWHTSVAENEFQGEYDEEEEKYDLLDWEEAGVREVYEIINAVENS